MWSTFNVRDEEFKNSNDLVRLWTELVFSSNQNHIHFLRLNQLMNREIPKKHKHTATCIRFNQLNNRSK